MISTRLSWQRRHVEIGSTLLSRRVAFWNFHNALIIPSLIYSHWLDTASIVSPTANPSRFSSVLDALDHTILVDLGDVDVKDIFIAFFGDVPAFILFHPVLKSHSLFHVLHFCVTFSTSTVSIDHNRSSIQHQRAKSHLAPILHRLLTWSDTSLIIADFHQTTAIHNSQHFHKAVQHVKL